MDPCSSGRRPGAAALHSRRPRREQGAPRYPPTSSGATIPFASPNLTTDPFHILYKPGPAALEIAERSGFKRGNVLYPFIRF